MCCFLLPFLDSFMYVHIWACPPAEGDDYIFHRHPTDQKIPKPKRLQDWYRRLLDRAVSEGAIADYKVLSARFKVLLIIAVFMNVRCLVSGSYINSSACGYLFVICFPCDPSVGVMW